MVGVAVVVGAAVVVVVAHGSVVASDGDCAGASSGAPDGDGVGVVVGCAAAIPPPVAINTDTNEAITKAFLGEARLGHDKFRYFAVLAIWRLSAKGIG
ncbi:hypothetical protein [Rhodococcus sp. JS3073]|uniref:hypothetical protein n=1 Tax=Rhodococcus sp. JS3073 TaxID=3002901 RepID=UPI0022863E48|nr:hypothetical protein [Rhodococcus sp. JS3073]WAM14572.1 hypothetical protein OYT95_35045 [Rhodococcus sp. JS3073]